MSPQRSCSGRLSPPAACHRGLPFLPSLLPPLIVILSASFGKNTVTSLGTVLLSCCCRRPACSQGKRPRMRPGSCREGPGWAGLASWRRMLQRSWGRREGTRQGWDTRSCSSSRTRPPAAPPPPSPPPGGGRAQQVPWPPPVVPRTSEVQLWHPPGWRSVLGDPSVPQGYRWQRGADTNMVADVLGRHCGDSSSRPPAGTPSLEPPQPPSGPPYAIRHVDPRVALRGWWSGLRVQQPC